jgi:hypothetical protein
LEPGEGAVLGDSALTLALGGPAVDARSRSDARREHALVQTASSSER